MSKNDDCIFLNDDQYDTNNSFRHFLYKYAIQPDYDNKTTLTEIYDFMAKTSDNNFKILSYSKFEIIRISIKGLATKQNRETNAFIINMKEGIHSLFLYDEYSENKTNRIQGFRNSVRDIIKHLDEIDNGTPFNEINWDLPNK